MHRVIAFYIKSRANNSYDSFELGEVGHIIAGEFDGVQVRVLGQVLQLISTEVVGIQFNLYTKVIYLWIVLLTLLSSGRSGRFTRDFRAVLLNESISTFLNSSK